MVTLPISDSSFDMQDFRISGRWSRLLPYIFRCPLARALGVGFAVSLRQLFQGVEVDPKIPHGHRVHVDLFAHPQFH
jgi:hypothetical protein